MSSSDKTDTTSNIIDVTNDGGVLKEILKTGSGTDHPPSGSNVSVHYVGTLLDGTKFDSSRDRGEYFTFELGASKVIKGWEKVVETMKKGEICKVTLKPEYAYGKAGSPPKIPAEATLVFEIELVSWHNDKDISKNKDGSIMKTVVKEGEKWETPNFEAKCKFHLKITGPQDEVYVSGNDLTTLEIGSEDIPDGLQHSLESMKKGEESIFKVKAERAYGATGNKLYYIPPNTDITYHIRLVDFEKGKESWQLDSFQDKFDMSVHRKNDGNTLFEKGSLNLAIQKYDKVIDMLKYDTSFKDDEKQKAKELKLTTYLNLAAVYLKLQNYKLAIENANHALEIDNKNIKGLWRRGVAESNNGDWDNAGRDFEKALEFDPENKSVKASYAQLKKKIAAADKKDKQRYQNLFQRLADDEEHDKTQAPPPPQQEDQNKSNTKPEEVH